MRVKKKQRVTPKSRKEPWDTDQELMRRIALVRVIDTFFNGYTKHPKKKIHFLMVTSETSPIGNYTNAFKRDYDRLILKILPLNALKKLRRSARLAAAGK